MNNMFSSTNINNFMLNRFRLGETVYNKRIDSMLDV